MLTVKELKYTVHDEKMYLVAIDVSDRPFLFYSMNLGNIEGRSLSRKASKVYEYSTGHKLVGKIRSKSGPSLFDSFKGPRRSRKFLRSISAPSESFSFLS